MSKWLSLFTLLLIIGFAKAHHIMRLIILAALGLAGLWMLHTLAQDFNKIYNNIQHQTPAATIPKIFLSKRSINNSGYLVNEQIHEPQPTPSSEIDWERILTRDPVGCARSFVCQLVATNPRELPHDETSILLLVRYSSQKDGWASRQLQTAMKHGQEASNPTECRSFYKFCPYSSKTMMSLLRLFGGT